MLTVCRLSRNFSTESEIKYGRTPNIYFLSKEQSKLGMNVHVISCGNGPNTEIDGIHVHYVRQPYSINYLLEMRRLSKTEGIDIVHSEGTAGLNYAILRGILTLDIPLVTQVPDTVIGALTHSEMLSLLAQPKSALKERYVFFTTLLRERILWNLTDAIITPSRAIREELSTFYHVPLRKIFMIPNGVDTSLFRPVRANSLRKKLHLEDKNIVLYIGHFGLRKGIEYLLMSIPKVVEAFPDVVFVLVGGTPKWLGTDRYWSMLNNTIGRLSIKKYVRLLDAVPHSELPEFYSMGHLFAFPTLYEGMPKAILEAMACERPVVASSTTGVLDVIEDGKDGILVSPRNPSALADAIISLLSDSKKSRDIARAGRSKVLSSFSWQRIAKQTLDVYKMIIQEAST